MDIYEPASRSRGRLEVGDVVELNDHGPLYVLTLEGVDYDLVRIGYAHGRTVYAVEHEHEAPT